tara:strand:- start:25 stop:708 length:684 start_codon:yes stop_codon:yes gene_type:complete
MRPFQYLFNKFWSDEQQVTILGYEEPTFELYDNFNFISLGEQTTVQDWCSDLKSFFETIDDKYFIHAVEDQFIIRPVRQDVLPVLYDLMNDDVGRIALETAAQTKPHTVIQSLVESEQPNRETPIIELDQEANYRLSVVYSIWNKEYMLKYLEPNMNPWEFELAGSEKAKNDGYKILGTKYNHPIYCSHTVRRGDFNNLDFTVYDGYNISIDDDTLQELKTMGLINE